MYRPCHYVSLRRKGTRLDPKVAKFWAVQVALAFEYLHNVDVIFRDLKPENLLVDYRSVAGNA